MVTPSGRSCRAAHPSMRPPRAAARRPRLRLRSGNPDAERGWPTRGGCRGEQPPGLWSTGGTTFAKTVTAACIKAIIGASERIVFLLVQDDPVERVLVVLLMAVLAALAFSSHSPSAFLCSQRRALSYCTGGSRQRPIAFSRDDRPDVLTLAAPRADTEGALTEWGNGARGSAPGQRGSCSIDRTGSSFHINRALD